MKKLSTQKLVCLDVTTRWNSTYLMLDSATYFQKAFERLEITDLGYYQEFCRGEIKQAPTIMDWDNARHFVQFLKVFYEATLMFSGSLYVTSNFFLDRICFIHDQLDMWSKCEDYIMMKMASDMKVKFDKYWGGISKMNMMLFVSVLLDPRYK